MDVETDTGRAHKRARVTLRSVDGDSRVVLEVSEDVAEEEAGGTPAPRPDLRAAGTRVYLRVTMSSRRR
jgi:hypothetical protein